VERTDAGLDCRTSLGAGLRGRLRGSCPPRAAEADLRWRGSLNAMSKLRKIVITSFLFLLAQGDAGTLPCFGGGIQARGPNHARA
jgi:hypothetical protein